MSAYVILLLDNFTHTMHLWPFFFLSTLTSEPQFHRSIWGKMPKVKEWFILFFSESEWFHKVPLYSFTESCIIPGFWAENNGIRKILEKEARGGESWWMDRWMDGLLRELQRSYDRMLSSYQKWEIPAGKKNVSPLLRFNFTETQSCLYIELKASERI